MFSEDHTLYIAPNFDQAFMIPREQMPQIAGKDVKHFLGKCGVKNETTTVATHSLKPTQSQFNTSKIDAIGKTDMPILVSNNGYVLDGHHRWLANHYNKNDQVIIKLPWDAQTSLIKMQEYEKTFSSAIHEEGVVMTSGGDSAPAVSIGNKAMDNTVVIPKKKKQPFGVWKRENYKNVGTNNRKDDSPSK